MSGMAPYLVRRLLWLPVILLVVSLATFLLGRYGPGDPVQLRLGLKADPESVQRVRDDLGLNDPILVQYVRYMGHVLQGDFGQSLARPGQDVGELIFPKMWVSVRLGMVALIVTVALGIPLGLTAALRHGTWMDPFSIGAFLFFQSVPVVVTVPLLQLLLVLKLGWLPSAGWDGLLSTRIIMPVIAMSLPGVAGVGRLMRAMTLSVLDEEYVRTARAKGLDELTVMVRHVMRNALLPMTTVVGLSLVTLLEGAFFTETLFGIPGVARLTVESVFQRDYDVIMAMTLIMATAFVIANIVIDIAYTIIDPRVRLGRAVEG